MGGLERSDSAQKVGSLRSYGTEWIATSASGGVDIMGSCPTNLAWLLPKGYPRKGERTGERHRCFHDPVLEAVFVAKEKEKLRRLVKQPMPIPPFIINRESDSGRDEMEVNKIGKSKGRHNSSIPSVPLGALETRFLHLTPSDCPLALVRYEFCRPIEEARIHISKNPGSP